MTIPNWVPMTIEYTIEIRLVQTFFSMNEFLGGTPSTIPRNHKLAPSSVDGLPSPSAR